MRIQSTLAVNDNHASQLSGRFGGTGEVTADLSIPFRRRDRGVFGFDPCVVFGNLLSKSEVVAHRFVQSRDGQAADGELARAFKELAP